MRRVPTSIHGIVDYLVGAGLIAAPEVTDMAKESALFARTMGAAAITYSLLTDYELGVFKLISMPVHLRIDGWWASALALGPWAFGFGRRGARYWVPYTLLSLTAGALVAISEPQPRERRAAAASV